MAVIGVLAALEAILSADTAPVSPIWGLANALLNAATVVLVALIYRRGRGS